MVQQKKIEITAATAERIRRSSCVVFVDYRGMTVAEATKLRRRCRESGVHYQVVKNRLIKRALAESALAPPEQVLEGPTALALAGNEPTAPARVLMEFKKDTEHLTIKGGFLGKTWLEPPAVEALAKIPSREVMLARLTGSLKGPIVRVAWALRAPAAKLAMALKAVASRTPAAA